MRELAIGHIHGFNRVFSALLEAIEPGPAAMGLLTCFDVTQETFIQCNHSGQRRTFSLRSFVERGGDL